MILVNKLCILCKQTKKREVNKIKFITITKNERGFDENFEAASFDTKDEAVKKSEEITSALYDKAYSLNHGEYARPEFKAQGAISRSWKLRNHNTN